MKVFNEHVVIYNTYVDSNSSNRYYHNTLYRTDVRKPEAPSVITWSTFENNLRLRQLPTLEEEFISRIPELMYTLEEFAPIAKYGKVKLYHQASTNTFRVECFDVTHDIIPDTYDSYFQLMEECNILNIKIPEYLLL